MPTSQLIKEVISPESEPASPLSKEGWSQHFTPIEICELMMKRIPISDVGLTVDLSVGEGELLWYAKKKWPACRVIGFDIDQELVDHCKSRFGRCGTFECVDTLRTDLTDTRVMLNGNSRTHAINLALSNPPFGTTNAERLAPDLLDTLSLHNLVWKDSTGRYQVHTEAAFFVRNLELVQDGGYVAILLPEGLISGAKTEPFRHFLLTHTRVRLVLSLPTNSFESSEARISLVVAQKSSIKVGRASKIHLGSADGNIESIYTVTVKQKELFSRMDPRYHIMNVHLKNVANDFKPLGRYLDSCGRGNGFYGDDRSLLTHKGDLEYIHSTDIRNFVIRESHQRLMVSSKLGRRHQRAFIKKGDVLLVRVGKGCVGRCAIVTRLTKAFASDCVYVLSSKQIDLYYLCLYLNTPFAKKYFDACTRGVCSRYITKADLMAMPLYLPEQKVIRGLTKSFKNILDKTSSSYVSEEQLADASVLANELNTLISDTIETGDYPDDSAQGL
jgi:type I restriction enzyme M protein